MAAENEISIRISAQIDSMQATLQQMTQVMQGATQQMVSSTQRMSEQIKQHTDKVESGFAGMASNIKGHMTNIGTVLAGAISAHVFHGAIEAALNYNHSILGLKKIMGITAEEASVLNVALKLIGSDSEAYTGSNMKLARQLKTNEDALQQIGLKTREFNGQLLSQTELFENAIKLMMSYKEGADRDQAALYLFGKSGADAMKFAKLNAELMAQATDIANKYGLVMGKDAVDANRKFEIQLNASKMIMESVKIKVGQELLPEIVKLTGYLGESGPGACKVMIDAVKILIHGVEALTTAIRIAVTGIAAFVTMAETQIIGMANIASALARQDMKGAYDAALTMRQKLLSDIKVMYDMAGEEADKYSKRVAAIWDKSKPKEFKSSTEEKGGAKAWVSPKDGTENQVAIWKRALEQMKVDEEAFFNFSIQRELAYWEEKRSLIKGNSKAAQKEQVEVDHLIFELKKRQAQEELQLQIDKLNLQQTSEKTAMKERLRIEEEKLKLIEKSYGKESIQYQKALIEKQKLLNDAIKQEKELEAKRLETQQEISNMSIETKQREANFKYQMGLISAREELQVSKDLENHRYKMEQELLKKTADLWKEYPQKWEEIQSKIAKSTQKHDAEIEKTNHKMLLETKKDWDNVTSNISRAFSGAIMGMINGTMTFRQAMASIMQSILQMFIEMLVKMVVEWISKQIFMAVFGQAIQSTSAVGRVTSEAAVGAAAAGAAVAGIPIVGPAMAPAAAAATFAELMAFAPIAGFAQGAWEIPRDMVAQIHQGETILPAPFADDFRSVLAGKQKQGGSGASVVIQAMDSQDVKRFMKRNGKALVKGLEGQIRNNNIGGMRRLGR